MEMTSKRPPSSTSFIVGSITALTLSSVSTWPASPSVASRNVSTWATSSRSTKNPTLPASAKISGGNDRIAKNAASAASPVTR
jgi:hypothetical protein